MKCSSSGIAQTLLPVLVNCAKHIATTYIHGDLTGDAGASLTNSTVATTTTYINTTSNTFPTMSTTITTKSMTLVRATSSHPIQCQTAVNFTESWRLLHNGEDVRGGGAHSSSSGYACDIHEDTTWFRFTGAAGKRAMALLIVCLFLLCILLPI